MTKYAFLMFGIVLYSATAAAQTPKVTISAGAALQPTTGSFTDITTFPYLAETARLEGLYDVGNGVAFDIGGGVRVWRRLSVGAGVTRVMRKAGNETTGRFPHPFFFNMDRTGTSSADSLDRTETGVHVSAGWQVVDASRLSVNVFGGPSFFTFKQAVIDDVVVNQSYPYDTIDMSLVQGTIDDSTPGFHAGADVGWFFTKNFGIGGLLRFTGGTKKNVRIGEGEPFDLKVGGLQSGGGIRLRF